MLKLANISAHISKDEKILEKVNAHFAKNSVNLILGPNAAGKTTFADVIAGNENISFKGNIIFENENIASKKPHERARKGILLLHQNPAEIPGVKIFDFLYASYKAVVKKDICVWDFNDLLLENLKKLKLTEDFLQRNINESFSGGEKKKLEILQMLILKPKVVIMDEIDSGLDIDTVKDIFKIVQEYQKETKCTLIIISHAPQILKYITPKQVLVIQDSSIKKKGDIKLAKTILKNGYKENY